MSLYVATPEYFNFLELSAKFYLFIIYSDMDYLVSTASLLILDSMYISVTKPYFESLVKGVQKLSVKPRFFSIIGLYVLLLFGLYTLVISKRRPPKEAFLLGVVIYGIFELTNYSLFDKWSLFPVLFDTLWGGILLYLVTRVTYFLVPAKEQQLPTNKDAQSRAR